MASAGNTIQPFKMCDLRIFGIQSDTPFTPYLLRINNRRLPAQEIVEIRRVGPLWRITMRSGEVLKGSPPNEDSVVVSGEDPSGQTKTFIFKHLEWLKRVA